MSDFLSQLPKTTTKAKKRLGRGYGSGKGGHTVGRGQKGQKSRTQIPLLFTGTKNKKSLIQRTPVLRGKNKMKPLRPKPLIVQLSELNRFKKGTEITLETLINAKLVNSKEVRKRGVKILADSDIQHPLKVMIPVSKAARQKIEKAGGSVSA